MKLLAALTLSIGLSFGAVAEEDFSMQSLMALGKLTGLCGIFTSQLIFQDSTIMPNGDEFLVRYWTTEAARLGMTLEELGSTCKTSVEKYNGIAVILSTIE